MRPRVNITVVSHNRLALTRLCLESLARWWPDGAVAHVVDNGSTDGTRAFLLDLQERDPRLQVFLLSRNMGVSVAANLGWAAADADAYLKLDNDMLIRRADWLDQLVDAAARNPELGMIGYQFCSWHVTRGVVLQSGDRFVESDCCGGGCVLIPRAIHERFGFWNEDYGPYGFEDLDYGTRVSLGGCRIGYIEAPGRVEHLGYAENFVDADREAAKRAHVASETRGKKLYVLNKLMFEQGARPLYVPRKYLPEMREEGIRFRTNPDYQPLLKLQARYVPLVDFSEGPEGVRVDLRRIRKEAPES